MVEEFSLTGVDDVGDVPWSCPGVCWSNSAAAGIRPSFSSVLSGVGAIFGTRSCPGLSTGTIGTAFAGTTFSGERTFFTTDHIDLIDSILT